MNQMKVVVASSRLDYPLNKISFAPVIPDPGKIICVGLNYRDPSAKIGAAAAIETCGPGRTASCWVLLLSERID